VRLPVQEKTRETVTKLVGERCSLPDADKLKLVEDLCSALEAVGTRGLSDILVGLDHVAVRDVLEYRHTASSPSPRRTKP